MLSVALEAKLNSCYSVVCGAVVKWNIKNSILLSDSFSTSIIQHCTVILTTNTSSCKAVWIKTEKDKNLYHEQSLISLL